MLIVLGAILLFPELNNEQVTQEESPILLGDRQDSPSGNFVDFLAVSPSPTQRQLHEEIYTDEYYVYPCLDGDQKSNAIVLVGQYKPVNGENTFIQAQTAVSRFEKDMYRDWSRNLFVGEFNQSNDDPVISVVPVSDPHVLADTYRLLRYEDTRQEIRYGWLLNYLVVATTEQCLFATMESIYHIH